MGCKKPGSLDFRLDSLLDKRERSIRDEVIPELDEFLSSLEGVSFLKDKGQSLEKIQLLIRQSGCDIVFDNSRVSLTFREIEASKHLTIILRTIKEEVQKTLYSKTQFPLIKVIPTGTEIGRRRREKSQNIFYLRG